MHSVFTCEVCQEMVCSRWYVCIQYLLVKHAKKHCCMEVCMSFLGTKCIPGLYNWLPILVFTWTRKIPSEAINSTNCKQQVQFKQHLRLFLIVKFSVMQEENDIVIIIKHVLGSMLFLNIN